MYTQLIDRFNYLGKEILATFRSPPRNLVVSQPQNSAGEPPPLQ